jgi:hypothetical protein
VPDIVTGEDVGVRVQVPLKTAFSMTVHGSQGLTLDEEFEVDLGGMFCNGQEYVALSRGRNAKSVHLVSPLNRLHTSRAAVLFLLVNGCPPPVGVSAAQLFGRYFTPEHAELLAAAYAVDAAESPLHVLNRAFSEARGEVQPESPVRMRLRLAAMRIRDVDAEAPLLPRAGRNGVVGRAGDSSAGLSANAAGASNIGVAAPSSRAHMAFRVDGAGGDRDRCGAAGVEQTGTLAAAAVVPVLTGPWSRASWLLSVGLVEQCYEEALNAMGVDGAADLLFVQDCDIPASLPPVKRRRLVDACKRA